MNIKILGETFIVKESEVIDYNCDLLGQVDHMKNEITIKKELSEDKKNVTLIHEILHVIFEQLGFNEDHDNEHLIKSLSSSIYQVFSDNELF